MTLKKDSTIQLEQKIIHYRAEISHFEQKLRMIDQKLKKEKIRNQYLQKKLYETEHVNIRLYENEIQRLKDELLTFEVMLEEEKERTQAHIQMEIAKMQEPIPDPKLQAFFNYAFLLSEYDDVQMQLNIIGDLSIQNPGTEPLHDIIVCIRIKPHDAGFLSGKILKTAPLHDDTTKMNPNHYEWQFVHQNYREKIRESGEYWIKPTYFGALTPSTIIRFENFDITLKKPIDGNSVMIEGFVYSQEFQTGINVENKIIVNF